MDAISRTCPGCQAVLEPDVRSCPRCGHSAAAAPGTARVQPEPDSATRTDWILPAASPPAGPQPGRAPARLPAAAGRAAPGYPPAAYPPPAYPPPGYPPPARPFGADLAEGPSEPPRQPPRRHNGNRPRSSRGLWILLPLLLVIALAAILLARPFGHSSKPSAGATGRGRLVGGGVGRPAWLRRSGLSQSG